MNWPPQWKVLWLGVLVSLPRLAFSACGLPDDVNEKKQFFFAEKMIEDGLLTSARDYLQCYRASKAEGEFRFVAMKLEGEVLIQMGESYWPQAQILFEEWLNENPFGSEGDHARLQLGKIHFRFDRPQVAEETLAPIPPSSIQYGPARSLMGRALFQRMLRYQEKGANVHAADLAPRVAKFHEEALQYSLTKKEAQISNYQAGFTLYQNKQFNKALPFWENYLNSADSTEESEDIRYRVATIHQSQKNWLQAEQRYGEYTISKMDLPPENKAQASFWWGEVAFQRAAEQLEANANGGTLEPAFVREITPRYEQYLATNDNNYRPLATFRLGQLYQAIDLPKQAAVAYQRYLKTKDIIYQKEAHYELGMLYARQNEPKLALEHLLPLRNQERYRQEPGFWTMLVQQHDALGEKSYAEQILRDAYNNGSFIRNTQLRFLEELASRQYNEKRCIELLSELAPLSDPSTIPEARRLIWQRGSCFLKEKQWSIARKDFEQLLEDPDFQESAFRGMLFANQQMQDIPAQLNLLEWASEQPNLLLKDEDWQTWVEILRTDEDWPGLQQAYVRWDQQPQSSVRKTLNHLLQWADAEKRMGNRQTEIVLLEQALYLLPDNAEPPREQLVRRLSEIYLARKEPQKIPPLYKVHLLALLPENSLIYRNYALQLGEVLAIDMQQPEQALPWLAEADAGSDTPNDLRAAVLRASIHQKGGQLLLALPIWERLAQQEVDPSLRFQGSYQSAIHYDKLNDIPEALVRFERVLNTSPDDAEQQELLKGSKLRIRALRNQQFREDIAKFQQQQDWLAVSNLVRQYWEGGLVEADERLINVWVGALQNQQDWTGLLNLYKELHRKEPVKFESIADLIWQAEAHEKVEQPREAISYYERAAKKMSSEDERFAVILNRLAVLYENGDDYEKQIKIYEELYAHEKSPKFRQQYALKAGLISLDKLQNELRSTEWLKRADSGGVDEIDLRASMLLIDMDRKNDNLDGALNHLKDLEKRSVSANSSFFWQIPFQLGVLHQNRKEWAEARPYLLKVANQQQYPDLETDAQRMLRSVDSVIARQELQKLLDEENLQEVSQFITEQVKQGNLPFDQEIFGIWIQAETKQQNWSRVLELYGRLQGVLPEEVEKVEALLAQGEAAEKLEGWIKARAYYEKALAKLSLEDNQRRIWVIGRLQNVFERDPREVKSEFAILVAAEFDQINDLESRKQLAGLMLYWARDQSKDSQMEREWLIKMGNLDAGEASVQARLRLADILNQEGNKAQAIQVLRPAASSNLKISSKSFVPVYLRLGDWNQDQEKWSEALKNYQVIQSVDSKKLDPEVKTYVEAQIAGLSKYLGTQQLANAIKQKEWPLVSKLTKKGLTDGTFQPNVSLFRSWLQAETEQKRWPEVLAIYEQLETIDPQSVDTLYDYQVRGQATEATEQTKKAVGFYSKAYELAEPKDKANWALYIADRQQDANEKKRWQNLAYEQTSLDQQFSLAQRLANLASERKDWPNEKFWLAKLDRDGNSEVEMQALWRWVEQAKTEKNSKNELEALQKILIRKPKENSSWFTLTHYRLGQLHLQAKRKQDAAQSFLLVAQANSHEDYEELRQAALRQWKSLHEQEIIDKLIQLEKKADWVGLSYLIRKEQLAGALKLDEANFSMLLQAEIKQQNWKGVLRAYQLLEQEDKRRITTPEALLIRAQATRQLQGWQPAVELYKAAIEAQPKNSYSERLKLLEEARPAFEKTKQIKELVGLYEKTCPHLKSKDEKQACAEVIVYYAQNELKNDAKAQKWLVELDKGGKSDSDLAALLEQSNQARQKGDISRASQKLKQLLERKPDPNSVYAVIANYQLGADLQQAEKWTEAQGHYETVVKAKPTDQNKEYQKLAEQQFQQIDQYLFGVRIQNYIDKQDWKNVSKELKPVLEKQGAQASSEWIVLWRQAEISQQNWKEALATWELQRKANPESAVTPEALIQQGALKEQLADAAGALLSYRKLLEKAAGPSEEAQAVERISAILQQQRNYKELVKFYSRRYEKSKDPEAKKNAASEIASYYATVLENPESARIWWDKVDQGGTSQKEIAAVYELAKMDGAIGKTDSAILRLESLITRPVPKNTQWFVLVHYQLAALYHTLEKFPDALRHYQEVAEHPEVKGLEQYKDLSNKTALQIEAYLAQLH
jgi:tetratricopeptide (TPR) repeat protein